MLQVDMRSKPTSSALVSEEWLTQTQMEGLRSRETELEVMHETLPHLDGMYSQSDDLKGSNKGVLVHSKSPAPDGAEAFDLIIYHHSIHSCLSYQLQSKKVCSVPIWAEEHRGRAIFSMPKMILLQRIASKKNSQIRMWLITKTSESLEVRWKRIPLKKSWQILLPWSHWPQSHESFCFAEIGDHISVLLAVKNVCTKVFVQFLNNHSLDAVCYFVAKVICYLDQKLTDGQTTDKYFLPHAFCHPNMTTCAYCGKDDATKRCSRCKLAKYCIVLTVRSTISKRLVLLVTKTFVEKYTKVE